MFKSTSVRFQTAAAYFHLDYILLNFRSGIFGSIFIKSTVFIMMILFIVGVQQESSVLVPQELSNHQRAIPLYPINVSGDFNRREFAAARKYLKPGKTLRPRIYLSGACIPCWS